APMALRPPTSSRSAPVPPPPGVRPRVNRAALGALALGLLVSPPFTVTAIPLGCRALRQIGERGERGTWLVVAGFVLAATELTMFAVAVVVGDPRYAGWLGRW